MSNQLKTLLQFVVGIAISGGFLYYVYKDTSWEQLYNDLSQADGFWVLISGLALFLVFVVRALRWQMLLESSGHSPKKVNTLTSVLILYFVNSITPKIGEIVRCTALFKTDKVPVATSLGTVVSERAIDVIVLFVGVGLIFLFELERLSDLFGEIWTSVMGLLAGIPFQYLLILGLVMLAGIWFLRTRTKEGNSLIDRAKGFAMQMWEAGKSIFKLEKPGLFLLYTFLIWFLLAWMNYFFMLALPDTANLSFYFAILILFIGGIGWALPVPGGIGPVQLIVSQLFVAFGLSEITGINIATLSNGVTWVFSVGYGLIALFYLLFLIYRDAKKPS